MTSTAVSFFDGRITIDPMACNGKPTIRGKRITVQTILEFLSAGDSIVVSAGHNPNEMYAPQLFQMRLAIPATRKPVSASHIKR